MRRFRQNYPSDQGSALVSTLLVLVVLTIVVVAFLQSMTIERRTATSYLNRYLAELAAEAGLHEALNALTQGAGASSYKYIIETVSPNTSQEHLQLLQTSPDGNTVTNTTPLALVPGADSVSPDTLLLKVGSTSKNEPVRREVAWKILPYPSTSSTAPKKSARYSFWLEEAGAKQDLLVHSGETARGMLSSLSEVHLYAHSAKALTADQLESLKKYQISTASTDRKEIFTPQTVNQIVAPSPEGTENDYTIGASTALLTPEGKPRLNLTRLKVYIDGGTYQEENESGIKDKPGFVPIDYPGLPLTQGKGSNGARFKLVTQLLNEDGSHPADKENDWGPGNLEIVRKLFPDPGGSNISVQARQIVANIIDYIDEDLIPTTDGEPGPVPSGATSSGAQTSYNLVNGVTPTFLGVEARYDTAKGIVGHPYITDVGQGFIFNYGSGRINSTRVVGWVGMAYPWDSNATWSIGNEVYQVELQFDLDGSVSGGDRGTAVAGLSSGYFQSGWLSQKSGYYSSGDPTNANQTPTLFGQSHKYFLFPRIGAGGFDLANGYFTINQTLNANFAFNSLTAKIRVGRLIYKLGGARYLLQDFGNATAALIRSWTPASFKPSTSQSQFKIGGTYGQQDWLFVGDPRLNFLADGWNLGIPSGTGASSTGGSGWVGPASDNNMYSKPQNMRKDPLQGLVGTADKWFESTGGGLANHFPLKDAARKFNPQPSPDRGQPAMQSYAEFGFIHAGKPWQTLTLFNDPDRFPTQKELDKGDWKILDYIDLGNIPRHLNSAAISQREFFGRINVNSANATTFHALLQDVPYLDSGTDELIDKIIKSPKRPFLAPSSVFGDENIKNEGTSDSSREDFVGRIYPALSSHSQRFLIYCPGEFLRNGQTVSHVTLVAEVELRYGGGGTSLEPIVLRKFYQ